MQSIILAINISSADKINHSVSQLLVSALANEKISDVVIYLPQLDSRAFSTLCCLASGIEESGYVGNTHFFIPDEDKEIIDTDALKGFRNCFPKVFVNSKDSSRQIGDVRFGYFDSSKLYSDELEDYFNTLYSDLKRGEGDFCIATDNLEDTNILGKISSKISVLQLDDAKAFRSRTTSNRIYLSDEYIEKINLEYKKPIDRKSAIYYRKEEISIPSDNDKVIKRILEPAAKKKGKV